MAEYTYYNPIHDHSEIKVGDHHLQYGGSCGDGFCYSHQSFDCVLTEEELSEVRNTPVPDLLLETVD